MSSKENDSKLIVIFSGNPIDSEMVKNMLVEEGISASLKNQFIGTIAPWQVSGGGFEPVEVVIFERDREKALLLINQFRGVE